MKRALILYSGVDGQTLKIADVIKVKLEKSHRCDLYAVGEVAEVVLAEYDLIILGAAIRYGVYNKKFLNFVEQSATLLNKLNAVFYSVTLTARKKEKRSPQTNSYTRKFLENTSWRPKQTVVFAGALRYPQYPWYDRLMIQLIMKITGGETDNTKDIEYTDWDDVAKFAETIIDL